jgi:Family of unknown function (DUF5677)
LATDLQKAEFVRLSGDLTHQRTIHGQVYALLIRMLDPPPRIPGGKKGLIVFGFATRSIETALSVRILADHRPPLIEDASSLVRILAESVINAAFITVSDETMAERYDAWGDYLEGKQDKWTLEAFPKANKEELAETLAAIDRHQAEALRGFPDFERQRGLDFWKHLPDRAKVVDDNLGQREFAMLHETWRVLSNYVHQNAIAVRQRIIEDKDGITVGRVYTDEEAAHVLFACNESLIALCMLLDGFYCGKTHVAEWDQVSRAFRPYLY